MSFSVKFKRYNSYAQYCTDRNNQYKCWVNFKRKIKDKIPFTSDLRKVQLQSYVRKRLPVLFMYPEVRAIIKDSIEWKTLHEALPEDIKFFEQLDTVPFMPHPPSKRR